MKSLAAISFSLFIINSGKVNKLFDTEKECLYTAVAFWLETKIRAISSVPKGGLWPWLQSLYKAGSLKSYGRGD